MVVVTKELNPVLPNVGNQIEATLSCDEIIPFSRDYGNGKLWSIQDELDISRYSFDLNESFNNIDITLFMDENIKNALKNVIMCKNNEESALPISNNEDEVDEKSKAWYQEKNKLSNALNYNNGSICDGIAAKRAMEMSIAELYESMKYANDFLPCPTHVLSAVGILPLDSSKKFDQPSISNSQLIEDSSLAKGYTEIHSNVKTQAHEKKEYENQGKCFY